MSIAEFKDAVAANAYKNWFDRLSKDVILKTGISELREELQSAEKTSFYITENTIKEVISALSNAEASQEDVEKVFNNLKNIKYSRNRKAIQKTIPFTDGNSLYYPRISFDSIRNLLETGFSDVLKKAREKNPDLKISDFYQRGHVFGIFSKKVENLRDRLQNNTTMNTRARTLLIDVLTDFAKELEKQDLETSNLKSKQFELYSRYKKRKDQYLVELQPKSVNEEAGVQQSALSVALRKFFSPNLKDVQDLTKGGRGQNFIRSLIESKGSPSVLDLIEEDLVSILSGKKRNTKEYSIPLQKVRSKSVKINNGDLNKKIKKEKQNVKKLIASAKRVPPLSVKTETDLIKLLSVLNQRITQQIRQNMGTGYSRDVLNYRSGRFANSVKVDRLSESRAGMITVFYNYMKNPYATFSQGGRQENPRSRDPKLLISKSIREIASTLVTNRLRAVAT